MKKKKKSRARGPRIVSLCASVAQPRVIALSVLPSFPPSLPSVYKNRAPSGPRRHVDFCMQSFKTRGRGGGEPPVEVHWYWKWQLGSRPCVNCALGERNTQAMSAICLPWTGLPAHRCQHSWASCVVTRRRFQTHLVDSFELSVYTVYPGAGQPQHRPKSETVVPLWWETQVATWHPFQNLNFKLKKKIVCGIVLRSVHCVDV